MSADLARRTLSGRRRADRGSAGEKEKRRRSRLAYRSKRGREAFDVASKSFGEAIDRPAFRPLRLEAGERVTAYTSPSTAIIAGSGGGDEPQLVESDTPLRSPLGSGELAPVDLELERSSDGFAPKNPSVPTKIGGSPRDGVLLADQLRVSAGRSSDEPVLTDGQAFFGNLDGTDRAVDLSIAPAPFGAEFSWQLRSSESPERLPLDFELPRGATLREAKGGALDIVRDSERIASVSPVVASDADGEPVPTSYELDGDSVTVKVDHRERDLAWPVLVDPVVDSHQMGHPGSQPEYGGAYTGGCGGWWTGSTWTPGSNNAAKWTFAERCDGLWIAPHTSNYAATNYSPSDWAEWVLDAPNRGYIERWDVMASHGKGNQGTCVIEGIWDVERFAWAGGASWKHPAPYTPSTRPPAAPFAGPWIGRVGNPAYAGDPNYRGDACGDMHFNAKTHNVVNPNRDNMAVFGMWDGACSNCVGTGHGILRAAKLFYGDYDTPVAAAPVHTNRPAETQWVSRATPSMRLNAWETDPGLGIHQTALFYPKQGGPVFGTYGFQSRSPNCDGGNRRPCPTSFDTTIAYDTNDMDEGVNGVFASPYDPLNKYPANYPRWTTRVDRSAPQLSLSGDLWDQRTGNAPHLDVDSGSALHPLKISATDGVLGGPAADRRSGVKDVAIYVDGQEEDRITGDEDCQDSCSVTDEFEFDPSWVSEGVHTIRVVARDRLDHPTERSFSIRVVRDNFFESSLDQWRQDTQQQVDDEIPGVGLTGPMPATPTDWRQPDRCESSTTALRDCYDAVRKWGWDVREWLRQNLPAGVGGDDLALPPVFHYSKAEDTARDLTREMHSAFALAKKSLGSAGSLTLALGFHEPVTPAQLGTVVPMNVIQPRSALTGAFDPGRADWGGSVSVPIASTLAVSVEDFYAKQSQIISETISEFEQETPEDAQDTEDLQDALSEARAFKSQLDARQAFVTGVTVELSPTQALALLRVTDSPLVKSVSALSSQTAMASLGPGGLGDVGTNAATVNYAADDVEPPEAPARSSASQARARKFPTCAQRGQARADARAKRRLMDPHPYLWAPSRHRADTVLGQEDGDHHLKVHRIRFRYQDSDGLRWFCTANRGARGVEFEVLPYPEQPEGSGPDDRFSDNWESDFTRKYTQGNLPKPRFQDDLAAGPCFTQDGSCRDLNAFEKPYYPDFAIISSNSRALKYRERYVVNFTTNEGQTDDPNERVIYSGQATTLPKRGLQSGYCRLRGYGYPSCMFSRVDVCFSHSRIGQPAEPTLRIDWLEAVGKRPNGSSLYQGPSVALWKQPRPLSFNRKVTLNCDARPPNAGRRGE